MFGSASLPPGGVLPTCTVRATANTFASVTAVLPTPLVIPTALPFQDRVVNIALVSDPAVLLGTVYWKDAANGNPIFVGGADVTAPGAIVAFGPQQTTDPDGPGGVNPTAGNPPAITADLATQSAAGTGFWSFPGVRQAFGAATYTFTHSTTLTGSFDLTINESGRTVTASTGLAEPVVDDGNLDIVVLPKPGRIDGSVSIVTTRSPLPYGDAVIRATPPGATPVDVPVAADGSYAITPAAAGTWGLELASTPTGNLEPQPGQATQQVFVDATASAVAQPRQYVELGQVVTEFTDSANANAPVATYTVGAVSYPRMNVSLVSGPAPFPAWTDRVGNPGAEVGDASGRATAQRLSVSSVAPTALQMNYQITYDMPGYDLATATWQAFNEANVPIASGTGTPSIPVQIFAGTRVRIVVSVPKYGSISGVVRGLIHPPSVLPADVEPLTLAPAGPLTVTAQPVQDAAGTQFDQPGAGNPMETNEANDENIFAPEYIARTLPLSSWYFFTGRDAGLVPYYFPGVLILGWWLARVRRTTAWQVFVFLAFMGSSLGLLIFAPQSWNGGGGPIGNRYFIAIYPTLLFLAPAGAGLWPAMIAAIGGLACVGFITMHPAAYSKAPWLVSEHRPLRWFPIELTIMESLPVRLNRERGRILVEANPEVFLYHMDGNTYDQEADGFWVAGPATTDIVIRTALPLTQLDLRVSSNVANTVRMFVGGRSTGVITLVPNEEKAVQLRPPAGVHANGYEVVWTIRTSAGFRPQQFDPNSSDTRQLGVFIKPTYSAAAPR
jgi:hypothetical protein